MTNQTPAPTPKKENKWLELALGLGRSLAHNWPFKLLALFLAVCLWAMLITQEPTLTRDKVINDAPLTINNAETLKRNGLIVVSDLSNVPGVTIRAAVPQGQYNAVQNTTYSARVDLSRITTPGTQEVRILTTSSVTYGTVQEVIPAALTVEVEEYVTRYRVPVNLDVVGEAPDGYYVSEPTSDPQLVTVSGPASMVNRIVRADAVLDLATVKERAGKTRMSVPFQLIDDQNQPVESSLIQVTSESVLMDAIVVELTVYPEKSLKLSDVGLITGEPAPGYEIKNVTITPETFVLAGSQKQLDALDALYAGAQIDVTGLTESVNKQLPVSRPSGLVYMSQESVTAAVEIGPIIRTRTFERVPIQTINLGPDLTATQVTEYAAVTIEGPQLWLETLTADDLTLTDSLTGLTEGVYSVPLVCTVPETDEEHHIRITPYAIDVMVTKANGGSGD